MDVWKPLLFMLALSYMQSISFSVISRARNRNDWRYHAIASVFSNSIWFFTFRALVLANMTMALFVPYTTGTLLGSLTGAKVSMMIERWLNAGSDAHLKRTKKYIASSPIPLNGEALMPLTVHHEPFEDIHAVRAHLAKNKPIPGHRYIMFDGEELNLQETA